MLETTDDHKVSKEWYKHGWGLIIAVLFSPYFLIWYAWARSSWSKNLKIGLSTIVAIIMLPLVLSISSLKPPEINTPPSSNITQNQANQPQKQKIPEEQQSAQKAAEEKAKAEAAQKPASDAGSSATSNKNATNSTGSSAPAVQSVAPAESITSLPLKAICKDGTISYQDDPTGTDYRGMCSGHDGIKVKLGRVQ